MDSELDEDLDEPDEPLAKREKCEPDVIQVLQLGTMGGGGGTVLSTMGVQQPSTIRHCGGPGNAYASV